MTTAEDTDRIRVMIVDDHEMVRDGLSLMIDTCADLEPAGQARDAEVAILMCQQQQPDVVLMDLMMPGDQDGIAAIRTIHKRFPNMRIIALTSYDTDGLVQKALQAGAISYLKKNVSMGELAKAIRAAHAGQPTLSPEATQELIAATVNPAKPGHDLTDREHEVLALLIEGLNNRQIAERLVISRSTVKHHVSSILKKLDATNRAEAVAIAMEYKIVE